MNRRDGDSGAQGDERGHPPPSPGGRFDGEHGERDEHRQYDEHDQQIDPERDSSDDVWYFALQSPPDKGLHELMRTEEQRQRRQQEMTAAAAEVKERVDADRADHDPADDVSRRREAHTEPMV